ncbi:hypothetical protein DPMN_102478 [Dreissena polymorpha]|uniref:Uncharacterized protein n=1 Tax=Dreissena polymorpha TaxID=45954 RepID=A0A9D4LL12_DREPO|nr:hypothetical protein DPMN_102478 [Dreissena polymorpha]
MSKGTVYYIIRHVVKAKLRKKFKAHQLNMALSSEAQGQVLEAIYLKLKCGKMGENFGDKLKFVKRDAFARGFMACAALSSRGLQGSVVRAQLLRALSTTEALLTQAANVSLEEMVNGRKRKRGEYGSNYTPGYLSGTRENTSDLEI